MKWRHSTKCNSRKKIENLETLYLLKNLNSQLNPTRKPTSPDMSTRKAYQIDKEEMIPILHKVL